MKIRAIEDMIDPTKTLQQILMSNHKKNAINKQPHCIQYEVHAKHREKKHSQ